MKLVIGDLNSRLHKRLPGEERFIGGYVFGDRGINLELNSNRKVLLEFCAAHDIFVANTFFNHPVSKQVTFRNVVTQHGTPFSPGGYAHLDLFLARCCDSDAVLDIWS